MSIDPLRFGRPPGLPDRPFLNWPDLGGRLYPADSLSLACSLISDSSPSAAFKTCSRPVRRVGHQRDRLNRGTKLVRTIWRLARPTESLAPPNVPFFHKKTGIIIMKKFCSE